MPSRLSALLLMIVAPVLWSTAGVVTRHVERATPFETVFWRSLFACAFVAAALLTAFMLALQLTSTANTLVVMSVSPLLTALLARAFLDEPIALRTWLAVSAAAIGIGWMFASGLGAHSARDYLGMAIASLVPVAAAINVVTLRASSATVDLRPAVMLGGALSCLVAAPLAFPMQATGKDIALLGLLGLLEVLLGPLWAWLGAGETPARATLVGGAIVLGALVLNELAAFQERAPGAASAPSSADRASRCC